MRAAMLLLAIAMYGCGPDGALVPHDLCEDIRGVKGWRRTEEMRLLPGTGMSTEGRLFYGCNDGTYEFHYRDPSILVTDPRFMCYDGHGWEFCKAGDTDGRPEGAR